LIELFAKEKKRKENEKKRREIKRTFILFVEIR
jgi:hypothetical protein